MARISVVTPTYRRPEEAAGLLENLAAQEVLPHEVIMVDGAPPDETETQLRVAPLISKMPFPVHYVRHGGGTAVQRNVGIERVSGDFVAFIDDDIRLEKDFFKAIAKAFDDDEPGRVGGVVGYRTNEHFPAESVGRWRWYRRLRLLTLYEPGRYDFETGYPINANMQPPFHGTRSVDFMTTSCAVWRRKVLDEGLRFHMFFKDYGVLEDAHFSLRAGRKWRLLQCGDARCIHDHSPRGRPNRRRLGYKCVVNYYYVFNEIAGPLNWRQKRRFWTYQAFEFLRIFLSGITRFRAADWSDCIGRLEGYRDILLGRAW